MNQHGLASYQDITVPEPKDVPEPSYCDSGWKDSDILLEIDPTKEVLDWGKF